MKIGVVVAMPREYDEMHRLIGGDEGFFEGNTVILRRCGIAKVNAAVACTDLINEEHPDCILSTGLAGGLGDGINVFDVVVGTQYVYHDCWCGEGFAQGQVQGFPERFDTEKFLVDAVGDGERIRRGLICTGDIFATRHDMERIKAVFPDALAVDMESCALAQTCSIKGVPFISIRIISDSISSGDNYAQYSSFFDTAGDRSFEIVKRFLERVKH